ncbi:hypothetical protein KCH_40400 [Kitasatospora cheerisanensis KCTC 2395]|uniref:Uncharacterized protein n=1 Tax=Kitasatospora cheerisanensis KCTC 2395 TaxID=1348663 RepID=A0A066YWA8_9ACTN|nr:hypothetical protein KCH_40400 [Kitasatospora cheerisanensis KCTC 2395]
MGEPLRGRCRDHLDGVDAGQAEVGEAAFEGVVGAGGAVDGGAGGAEPARRLVLPMDGAIVTALREGSAAPAAEARSIAAALLAAPAPEPAAAA